MAAYTISRGDTLNAIAKKYGMTAEQLAQYNGLKDMNVIRTGASLNIPETGSTIQPVGSAAVVQDSSTPAAPAAPAAPSVTGAPAYSQSQALTDALAGLNNYEATRPGEYQSQYGDQIQGLLDQILNRKDFKYDFSADPIYNQYKDQYTQQGRMAMMDTMGQASALSGGYGNSYAQTAGQQAYQGFLGQLNNVLPSLQQAAYQQYTDQGNQLNNKLGIVQGLDQTAYGQYRDNVGDWNTQYGQMMDKINNMSDEEWRQFQQQYAAWESQRNFNFDQQQADLAEKWRQTEWDYQLAQDAKKGGGGSRGKNGGDDGDPPYVPVSTNGESYSPSIYQSQISGGRSKTKADIDKQNKAALAAMAAAAPKKKKSVSGTSKGSSIYGY